MGFLGALKGIGKAALGAAPGIAKALTPKAPPILSASPKRINTAKDVASAATSAGAAPEIQSRKMQRGGLPFGIPRAALRRTMRGGRR